MSECSYSNRINGLRRSGSGVLSNRIMTGLIVAAVSAGMVGCSTVTTIQPEPLELMSGTDEAAASRALNAAVDVNWWRHFSSPALDKVVAQGLQHNFDLQAAWERLAQSRAVAEQQASGKFPSLDVTAGGSRSWAESSTTDSWSVGLSTQYELDFWGRVAALDEQGRLDALASEAAGRVQANTTAKGVVEAWYGWVYQQQLLQLLEQQQMRLKQSLAATTSRFRRGLVVRSDVWQQQQLLESINADVIDAQRQQQLYGQQLAVWTANGHWLSATGIDETMQQALSQSVFPVLDTVPDVPLEALKYRPDVEQAWYQLQADNAGLATAVANRYPRLTLSASYSGSSTQWDDVFDNWIASLAANLVLPILDGGNRKATVLQREAQVRESIAHYQQTLLTSAQAVREAQVNESSVLRQVQSLDARLLLARQTEASQQARYLRGVVTLLQLITAQRSVLTLEQQLLAARWQQLQYRIQLYQAVSHGDFDEPAQSSAQLSHPEFYPDQKGDQA